jgi:TonB family protein
MRTDRTAPALRVVAVAALTILMISMPVHAQGESDFCETIRQRYAARDSLLITTVEAMPEPVDGWPSLMKKVSYTQEAVNAGVEGIVLVSFVVDVDGTARCLEIARGIGYGLDEAAIRAVEMSPFAPAQVRGAPVPFPMSVPIRFVMDASR